MMGRLKQDQEQLFYSFNLEEAVPEDHLVREIAAVLDLNWVYEALAPHYSTMGRPSIDPVLMIRMLIVGYGFAIRSERALCREVQVNLAYRWFCGLSIEDKLPDHSAFSRARNERFGKSEIFRQVFKRGVAACIAANLVGGEGFAVDASLIAADANKHRSIPGSEWNRDTAPERASRAVKIHGKPERITFSDKAAACPLDHVNRQFHAPAPNKLWVSDFTYVSTSVGMIYVAFSFNVYARYIVGRRVSRTALASFVLDAFEQTIHDRRPVNKGGLIHHNDRGSRHGQLTYGGIT